MAAGWRQTEEEATRIGKENEEFTLELERT